ncbi:uncharacterized protein [Macrobrachium rosenbergii]|uniref:uncharacterized protein n=1 Tax=Macrobrachium rosenbergii TaxID=79674 RepID=UPI0034D66BBB
MLEAVPLSKESPPACQGLCIPGSSSSTPDQSSPLVPLEHPKQCQSLSPKEVEQLPELNPVPGPDLVSVPVPDHVTDPPSRDPPNLTELVIANYEPSAPDNPFSSSPTASEDEPLADPTATPSPARSQKLLPPMLWLLQQPG